MNLSEIRRKAQQEKAGSAEVAIAPSSGALGECVGPAATPAEPAPEAFDKNEGTDIPPSPLNHSETPCPQGFDPMAVLLAGRAAARSGSGVQEDDLSAEHIGEDFQELLCFRVANEKYAVNIMEIKEIIKPREITEVPHVPPYISGVLSLRGIIIPVFNMHLRLGHAVMQDTGKERIIVVKKKEDFCGIKVDEVIQVVRIAPTTIEPPPAVLDDIDRDFVGGIGRFDGQMLILLNMEKVLDHNLH
jgi:purine-binding chemotaxis protein CheW